MSAHARQAIEEIPDYLETFIVRQDYAKYTPIDHASWRYIMAIARAFFKDHAHPKYLEGLEKTGISVERIPRIEEMDAKLRKFGWRAVAVSGFIPPAVFLEFEALGILPIACDMRALEHIAYTPAPDIVHEAAGHAPIISDPEYAGYLLRYGEIARKAIFSDQDMEVYEAIRNLSEVKENPAATEKEIEAAEHRLDMASAAVTYTSEATQLARMAWWTTEYGLIGSPDQAKIYGAGLLSSVGESYDCVTDKVQKIPMSLDCINTDYDITRPQPQLFVSPNFQTLTDVLEEFAETMAFRRGGIEALAKARRSGTVTTTELESGIQIGGVLTKISCDSENNPIYLQYTGPVQLAYLERQLAGQGPDYHKQGFGTPVGPVKGLRKSPADLTTSDLLEMGFNQDEPGVLEFESGVRVKGTLKNRIWKNERNLVLVFDNCTVTLDGRVLFKPEWGTFDMACGDQVVSVFGDAADRRAYLSATGGYSQKPGEQKSNLTSANKDLAPLYARVRDVREKGRKDDSAWADLRAIHETVKKHFSGDWLLRYEILELISGVPDLEKWRSDLRRELDQIAKSDPVKATLLQRGLALL